MSGHKIIDGLKDAVAGNFDRVTIEGQVWVKRDSEIDGWERLLDEIERLRAALRKIADHDYTDEDRALTSAQPRMIWELVARAALPPQQGGGAA